MPSQVLLEDLLGDVARAVNATMDLGRRRVRSAGRTSGSVEVTLPVRLHSLQGVDCSVLLRDGPRPEIVLLPDLSRARALFGELWQRLRLGLGDIGDIGELALADFNVGLLPPNHWHRNPPLAYSDALVASSGSADSGRRTEALGRLLSFLGVAAAHRLGLEGSLALAFGDAVGYLVTGHPAGLGADFQRGRAHALFWRDGPGRWAGGILDEEGWLWARQGFKRVYDEFLRWQRDPQAYRAAQQSWWRALAVEMEGSAGPAQRHRVARSG